MAFPSVAAYAQADSGISAVSSFACTMPAGIAAGDLLVAIIGVDQDRTVSANTIVSGSNWTLQQQGSPVSPDNLVTGAIITKIAEGGDVLTVNTDVADVINSYVIRISNASSVYVSTPYGSSSSANANPPNLVPAGGSRDYLWLVAAIHDSQVVATAAPENFTDLITNSADSSGGCSISWARRNLTASSLDPSPFTSTAEQYVTFTIAVSPPTQTISSVGGPGNIIYANSSNVVITGTLLANGAYAKLVYANQEILMVDYVTSNTQPYFTSPSLADVFASRIQFTDSANLQILNAQSGIVATKIVSFQPDSNVKLVHNVTDISRAGNTGSIYYGQSPAITVNDQIIHDANSTSNYSVLFDSQGYITIDSLDTDANDSFTYRVYESSSQVWGTEGTITFLGPS